MKIFYASMVALFALSLITWSCDKPENPADTDTAVNYANTDIGWFKLTADSILKHPAGVEMFRINKNPDFTIYRNGWVKVLRADGNTHWQQNKNYSLYRADGKTLFFAKDDGMTDVHLYDTIWKNSGFGWVRSKFERQTYFCMYKADSLKTLAVDETKKVLSISPDEANARFILNIEGGKEKYLSFAGVIDENEETNVPVSSVSLDRTAATLAIDSALQLNASVLPENATNKNVSWSSSVPAIASVVNGKVTALTAGTSTITVKTEDGNKTATCQITVLADVVSVSSVSLNKSSDSLNIGQTLQLSATVLPNNATNKSVTWSSNAPGVASVENGKITAISAGSTTITVKTEDGSKTATCNIIVRAANVPVTSVSLNQSTATLEINGTVQLSATVLPNNATNKNVTWSSNAPTIAKVENGKVTALTAGTATITATTQDGNKTANCVITVNAATISVESVSLNQNTANLDVGATLQLSATVLPTNATNKNVTWSSNNSAIAKVENGKVTALSAGTATITVKTEDGNKTATCVVTVKEVETKPVFVDSMQTSIGWFKEAENGDLYHPNGHMLFNVNQNPDFTIYAKSGYVQVKLNGSSYWSLLKEDGLFFLFNTSDNLLEINVYDLIWTSTRQWISTRRSGKGLRLLKSSGQVVVDESKNITSISLDMPNNRFRLGDDDFNDIYISFDY